MAPRKAPKQRGPPTPRVRVPRTPRENPRINETPNEEIPVEEIPVKTPTFQMSLTQLQTLIAEGIATALATYETSRNKSPENIQNPSNTPITNQTTTEPVSIPAATNQTLNKSCPRKNFMTYETRNFYGTENVVGITKWLEWTEAVFGMSSCSVESRVKNATCTLKDSALTWWNHHVKSIGVDIAYAMDWKVFKHLMIEEYCSQQEIQALEQELWNHKMKGSEIVAYTLRFNDLANLCPSIVNPECKKIKRYIWGLARPVQGIVTKYRPSTFDSAKILAHQLTKQCIQQGTMSQQTKKSKTGKYKRKSQEESRENSKHHKPEAKPVTAYAAVTNTPTQSKPYTGKLPYCAKCNFHHVGNCMICGNCKLIGHTSRFCRRTPTITTPTLAT